MERNYYLAHFGLAVNSWTDTSKIKTDVPICCGAELTIEIMPALVAFHIQSIVADLSGVFADEVLLSLPHAVKPAIRDEVISLINLSVFREIHSQFSNKKARYG